MVNLVLLVIPGHAERVNPESRATTSRFRIGPHLRTVRNDGE
jgi:hypothetical protein